MPTRERDYSSSVIDWNFAFYSTWPIQSIHVDAATKHLNH